MNTKRIQEALGMMNSMIISGEQHSDVSKKVLSDALTLLESSSLPTDKELEEKAIVYLKTFNEGKEFNWVRAVNYINSEFARMLKWEVLNDFLTFIVKELPTNEISGAKVTWVFSKYMGDTKPDEPYPLDDWIPKWEWIDASGSTRVSKLWIYTNEGVVIGAWDCNEREFTSNGIGPVVVTHVMDYNEGIPKPPKTKSHD